MRLPVGTQLAAVSCALALGSTRCASWQWTDAANPAIKPLTTSTSVDVICAKSLDRFVCCSILETFTDNSVPPAASSAGYERRIAVMRCLNISAFRERSCALPATAAAGGFRVEIVKRERIETSCATDGKGDPTKTKKRRRGQEKRDIGQASTFPMCLTAPFDNFPRDPAVICQLTVEKGLL